MLGVLVQNMGAGKEKSQGNRGRYKKRGQWETHDKQDLFDTLAWPGCALDHLYQTISK